MVRQNQGYRKDLNLLETINDFQALDNLGGAGISNDLQILQNNLRNTSTLAYNSLLDGFFFFGEDSEFVYTNGDVVTVNTNVNVGTSILLAGTEYYVCESNALNQFKLSTTPPGSGFSPITVTSVFPESFNFIRKDPVNQENLVNFIQPFIQDTTGFSYLDSSSINDTFDGVQANVESAEFLISKKYKGNADTTTTDILNYEGTVTVNDPANLNTSATNLNNPKSPGVFIGETRAFSSDNNPWNQVGTALSTSSFSVSTGEIFFSNDIVMTGISTEAAAQVAVTSYTHKLPITVNGETYFLLLRT